MRVRSDSTPAQRIANIVAFQDNKPSSWNQAIASRAELLTSALETIGMFTHTHLNIPACLYLGVTSPMAASFASRPQSSNCGIQRRSNQTYRVGILPAWQLLNGMLGSHSTSNCMLQGTSQGHDWIGTPGPLMPKLPQVWLMQVYSIVAMSVPSDFVSIVLFPTTSQKSREQSLSTTH